MMIYIIWVKIYVYLKEGLSSPEELNELDEQDPFWQLAQFSENDFLL
tara:strand:- start:119 stop:259 length:141 start_codon:yes stop_codon:yes gene_type:complete